MASPHTAETMKERGMEMQATSNMLWRMLKDGHAAECAMASSPVGVEGQFFLDGRILSSYQFGTESQAVVWAIEKCADLTTRGWAVEGRRSQQYLAA